MHLLSATERMDVPVAGGVEVHQVGDRIEHHVGQDGVQADVDSGQQSERHRVVIGDAPNGESSTGQDGGQKIGSRLGAVFGRERDGTAERVRPRISQDSDESDLEQYADDMLEPVGLSREFDPRQGQLRCPEGLHQAVPPHHVSRVLSAVAGQLRSVRRGAEDQIGGPWRRCMVDTADSLQPRRAARAVVEVSSRRPLRR